MSYEGECEKCDGPVHTHEAAWPVTGWELARSAGGANQIKHRERVPNIVVHAVPCLDQLLADEKRKITGTQESLLG